MKSIVKKTIVLMTFLYVIYTFTLTSFNLTSDISVPGAGEQKTQNINSNHHVSYHSKLQDKNDKNDKNTQNKTIETSQPLTFFSAAQTPTPSKQAGQLLAAMDDTELLGQVLLLGYLGISPSEEILEWIREKKIGGVKLFGHNTDNLPVMTAAISQMQKEATATPLQIPLFIATDQEGGWVRHVRGNTSQTPGNMAIGATNLPFDAYNTGFNLGNELKALGINMNFAPNIDLHTNPDAYVVGTRAFSDDPLTTAQLGVAFFKGQEASGVISTGKHFPGHGNTNLDSHGIMPIIYSDIETMWDQELMPYRFLIRRDVPAIMSAHIAFPSITGRYEPASLSSNIMHGLLREKLGFEGLIITDDMRMVGALGSGLTTVEACLSALKAGNDIIMISYSSDLHQQVWDKLYMELQSNPDFRETIENSVKRILTTKLTYLSGENSVPLYPQWGDPEYPFPSDNYFFFNHAFRSVTTIKNGSLPLDPDSTGKTLIAGQINLFTTMAKNFFPEADVYSFPFTNTRIPRQQDLTNLPPLADQYDTIIFCLANPNSRQVLQALEDTKAKVIVLSVLSPFFLQEMPWIDSAVAVYGTGRDSILAGLYAITGAITPQAELPVQIFLGPGERP